MQFLPQNLVVVLKAPILKAYRLNSEALAEKVLSRRSCEAKVCYIN